MIVRAAAIVALLLMQLGSEAFFASPQAHNSHILQRGQILRREIFGTGGIAISPRAEASGSSLRWRASPASSAVHRTKLPSGSPLCAEARYTGQDT